jgi:preprotein translocase subunit YajC
MHTLFNFIATTSTTTKGSHKSSSSAYTLLLFVLLIGGAYFLFLRPRQQRMRQQQATARQIAVGDEVVSAGGIFGRVVALDADAVEVEVAPGVIMTFLRRAVSPRPAPPPGSNPAPNSADEDWSAHQDPAPRPGEDDSPGDTPDQTH